MIRGTSLISLALSVTTALASSRPISRTFWPLDFFGDGPRIPLIVISPFSRGGKVSHTYSDHVSILKFIERNWDLQPRQSSEPDRAPG